MTLRGLRRPAGPCAKVVWGIHSAERSALGVSCGAATPPGNVRKPFRARGCLRARRVVLPGSPVGEAGLLKPRSQVALLGSSSRANTGPSRPRAALRWPLGRAGAQRCG